MLDGRTEHIVRAEVRGNVMSWTLNGTTGTACGSAAEPVTHFRYVTLGGILEEKLGWHQGSLVGLTVRRIKVVAQQ
ncbi:MAG TPA: hypothetical protein VES20_23930 [Bryobacteraceae bacterium]|nr:hypothetical protein [Bryobacteraceae bacterium]